MEFDMAALIALIGCALSVGTFFLGRMNVKERNT